MWHTYYVYVMYINCTIRNLTSLNSHGTVEERPVTSLGLVII